MKLVKGWMLAGVMLAAATAQAGSHGMSVDAMLEKASAANSKAKAMGYEWTITAPAIKKAQAAKEAGKADEAKGFGQQGPLLGRGFGLPGRERRPKLENART